MESPQLAEEKLAKALGYRVSSPHHSPEEIDLRPAFELLAGGTAGHRISKYGVQYGLTPLFQAVGDTVKVEAIKDYAPLIGQGIAGGVSLIALLFLKERKWSRIVAWGGLFQSVEAGIDYVESLVVGALKK